MSRSELFAGHSQPLPGFTEDSVTVERSGDMVGGWRYRRCRGKA